MLGLIGRTCWFALHCINHCGERVKRRVAFVFWCTYDYGDEAGNAGLNRSTVHGNYFVIGEFVLLSVLLSVLLFVLLLLLFE